MSQPKVLFIIPGYGIEMRGVETHFESLAKRMTNDIDVHLLSKSHQRLFNEKVKFHMVSALERKSFDWIYRLPVLPKLLKIFFLSSASEMEAFWFCLKSIPFMLQNKFDVIVPSAGFWTVLLAKLFSKSAKIMSIGHSGFVRKEARLADCFIALTPNALDVARAKLPELNTALIPNGVDVSRFQEMNDKEKQWDILSVGAFTNDKGHRYLLDALQLIKQPLQVLLAGKGPLENDLRNHPAFKQHHIEIKQFPFEEMPQVYNNAKVFTLASKEEAFGLVFLEALASGINIILNDSPNHHYVCGDVGYFCEIEDPKSYSEQILKALESEEAFENRKQAEKFSWDIISAQYVGSIKNLLKEAQ